MNIAEQKKAMAHLAFEVYHFRCYRRLYGNPRLAAVVEQAVRYSLLLHVRVLLGFFSKPKWTPSDDCWIGDFITDNKMLTALTPSDEARAMVGELHKRLAHFTRKRWDKPAPVMDFYAKYFDEIDTLINTFHAALPDDIREALMENLDSFAKSEPIP
jgi:hypothetical protein